MEAFRRSLSFQRHPRNDSESQLIGRDTPPLRRSEEQDRDSLDPRPRSSFDTFVIPNRTRYPSDKTRISEPTSIDLHIAASLLNRAQSEPPNVFASTSTLQKHDLSANYIDSYNVTARRFGLSEMSADHEQDATSRRSHDGATDTPSKVTVKKSIFQRLSRKHSVTAMTSRRSASTTKSHSLEDICRLGGVSVFTLPPAFAALHMIIPTALAATAEYLLQHGRSTPGIFRIPGQSTVIQAIYDYYQARLTPAEGAATVETTICSTDLPSHIQHNVHDIASTFKRFLWDLPGGILGSTSTFKALAEIEGPPVTKLPSSDDSESLPRSKLIALAILSVQSQQRLALICAVFGLLACLKLDVKSLSEHEPTSSSPLGSESMSPRAFGVVFAPVLLGNLNDEIEFHDGRKNSESSSNNNTPKRGLLSGKKNKKLKSSDCGPEIAAGVSRANAAAAVIEMLVRDWEEVVLQIRVLQGLTGSRSASQSSRLYIAKNRNGHDSIGAHRRPSVPSLRPKRSTSLTKSISNPNISSFRGFADQESTTYPESGGSSYTNRQDSSSLSRSASVSNTTSIHHDARAASGSRNFSYSSSALQSIDERVRWPSLHLPGDRAPVRSSGGSGESAPWWERSSGDETGPVAVSFPAPPPSPTRKSPRPKYKKVGDNRAKDEEAIEVNRVATVLDENVKLPVIQLNGSAEPVKLSSPIGFENTTSSSHKLSGLPAPGFQKVLSPKGSLDSVLSPLYKADRASLARASYRSLQHDVHDHNDDKKGSITPVSRMSPVVSHHQKATPHSASQQKSSPMHTVGSGEELRKTPRPTPSPRTEEHKQPREHAPPSADPNAVLKPKRSRIEASSPKRSRHAEPSEDSTYDEIRHSNPHTSQPRQQHYEHRQTTFRPPQLLPMPNEPEIARRLNSRTSNDQMISRNTSSEYTSGSSDMNQRASTKLNIGTLYAEIRRLKTELDARYDENLQLRQQLDAMRRFRDSGTLSEKLRDTERQLKFWITRAHWAENQLGVKYASKERQGSIRRS